MASNLQVTSSTKKPAGEQASHLVPIQKAKRLGTAELSFLPEMFVIGIPAPLRSPLPDFIILDISSSSEEPN
jgi:hypothetical protein